MTTYEYLPLPASGTGEQDIHIRLMTLSPGPTSGEISCTIATCLLAQPPKYEAVSYCWGSQSDTHQILCDGKYITVPQNLFAFLLCARAQGKERTLWIDSICINQADSLEKTTQVAAMRHIYSKASQTLVWLGPESTDSRLGLEFARSLCQAYYDKLIPNPEKGGTKDKKRSGWYWTEARDQFAALNSPEWGSFFRIFDREWFQRAWVVQEVAVSTQVLVIIGEKSILWLELIVAVMYALAEQTWIFEFYGSQHLNVATVMFLSQKEIQDGQKSKHYEVLARHRQSLSTEPRDRLFAFYGLSCHDDFRKHQIEPDYSQTKAQLCTKIAVSSLQTMSNLDYLDIPRLSRDPNENALPSWVVDWGESESMIYTLLMLEIQSIPAEQKPHYTATGESECKPVINSALTQLELEGYKIDRITSTSQHWVVQDTSGYQSIRKQALILQQNQRWTRSWLSVLAPFSGRTYPTGEDKQDAVWQVLVAGNHPEGKEQTKEYYKLYEKRQYYLRFIDKLNLHNFVFVWMIVVVVGHVLRLLGIPNPEMKFRALVLKMVNRKAFGTAAGYVGMGPRIAEVGDHIFLFKGAKLPFILRPSGLDWEFIGDCYMHGVMNGEKWDETKCEKVVLV